MQLILHAIRQTSHGPSRLLQAMSAWSVKTRHAPCRHSRDVRVYGHAAMAMHGYRVHAPPGCDICLIGENPTCSRVYGPETAMLEMGTTRPPPRLRN